MTKYPCKSWNLAKQFSEQYRKDETKTNQAVDHILFTRKLAYDPAFNLALCI